MHRLENWPELLAAFFVSRRKAPFAFGSNDCALFAMDAVLAMTGVDIGAEIRGTYNDQAGAAEVLSEANLTRIATAHGIVEVPVLSAHRGDVLLYIQQAGHTLLVLGLDGINGIGPATDGCQPCASAMNCVKAFRIPF